MRTLLLHSLIRGSIFLISFNYAGSLLAQSSLIDPDAAGRHFVIAYPDIGDGAENLWRPSDKPAFPHSLSLYLYSSVPNAATISSPGGTLRTIQLNEGVFERVDIFEINGGIVQRSGEVLGSGIVIRTVAPVIAYCYMETTSGADGWTPIPVENWGREYSGFTFPGQVLVETKRESRGYVTGSIPVTAPAGIMVIAAYDNTRVSINPSVPIAGGPPLSVTLNAGEVYQIQSIVDTSEAQRSERQHSLHGTRITATQPIGVLSGNTRFIPLDDIRAASDNTIKNLFYEWLTPINMLGSEFAFTPTWDAQRQLGQPGEDYSKKRAGESLFISGVLPGETEGTYRDIFTAGDQHFTVEEGDLHKQYIAGQARPGYLRTSQPAQVFMAPSPVSIGTQVGNGMNFVTYGSYVAEVVPVEQWANFSPFIPPITAKTMEHSINVVTRRKWRDSIMLLTEGGAEQLFYFNRGEIPGTDFVWGTAIVSPGRTYYLRGMGNARFSGTVYGLASGSELHGTEWFNPSYVNYIQSPGLVYGYTLSPRRNVIGPPDSITLDTARECATLNVSVQLLSNSPAGLRSIALASGAVNTRLRFLDPIAGEINGFVKAEFVVEPIDLSSNATAEVIITDRTGARTMFPYSHTADRFVLTNPRPGELLSFGPVSVAIDTSRWLVLAANQGDDPILIENVELAGGDYFFIAGTTPSLPATLPPGGKLEVALYYPPADTESSHRDSLRVHYGCNGTHTVPLYGETKVPCIDLEDLDFGLLEPGENRTLSLEITNTGEGHLYLRNKGNGAVLGLGDGFSTDAAPFNGGDSYRFSQGASISIDVKFTATDTGEFRRVLRFASNWQGCRDSSVLTARVRSKADTTTSGFPDAGEVYVDGNTPLILPNPFSGSASIKINVDKSGPVRLEIIDPTGTRRALLLDEALESGQHELQWDPGNLPSGIYYVHLYVAGHIRTSRLVFLK